MQTFYLSSVKKLTSLGGVRKMFYIYLKTLKVTIVREYLWFVAVLQLNVGFTMFIYQTWKYFNKILLFQRKLWQYWKTNFTANFTSSNFSQCSTNWETK